MNIPIKALEGTVNQLVDGHSGLSHQETVDVNGLDDLFKWASEMVADGEDARVKRAREQRIRRQVLDVIQQNKEQKVVTQANEEVGYLQRRLIATFQRLEHFVEENSYLKQILIAQSFALQELPKLESEVKRLQGLEWDKLAYELSQKELLTTITKLIRDKDFLEELVLTNESENARLAYLYKEAKAKITRLEARRWWHLFIGQRKIG